MAVERFRFTRRHFIGAGLLAVAATLTTAETAGGRIPVLASAVNPTETPPSPVTDPATVTAFVATIIPVEPAPTLSQVEKKYKVQQYPADPEVYMKDIPEGLYYFQTEQGGWRENVLLVWGEVENVDKARKEVTLKAGEQRIITQIDSTGAWVTRATLDPEHIEDSVLYGDDQVAARVKVGQRVDARVQFGQDKAQTLTSIASYE